MMEIILTIIKWLTIGSVLRLVYMIISQFIPEIIQLRKEEKMTVEERMELRKSRGQI